MPITTPNAPIAQLSHSTHTVSDSAATAAREIAVVNAASAASN